MMTKTTTNKFRFSYVGELRGKGRPRFRIVYGRNNKAFGSPYTPKETREYELKIKKASKNKMPKDFKIFVNPLKVKILAYHKIPKGTSRVQKEKMLNKKILPAKKPDADNIEKIILDALNGLAYKDDNQIVDLHIKKFYNNVSGFVCEIEEILSEDEAEQICLDEV